MKKYARAFLILLFATGLAVTGSAQSTADSTDGPTVAVIPSGNADSTKSSKELEESLAKAAAAAEKAAGKIRVIVEQKASNLAKTSQPYIDSLAASTASLIEKLALELEKIADEPSPKKAR
ncbi:hypothetical protein [Niabella aurantiaca]|uniref:hypothetical protein n=1 Tax=Niabella aurantiaca TaxID=379900 RepID=UPI000368ABBC|nr:hypothetical protein [Niabella aurantiaca]